MLAKDVTALPAAMQNPECEKYLALLQKRRGTLAVKRALDVLLSVAALILSSPLFLLAAALVGLTSPGGVFFRQERVKQNMQSFIILKFRTMRADKTGSGLPLTTRADARVTAVGRWLRRLHLDELPQLFNVLRGDMSIVGPRPEVWRYVESYGDSYLATLLVPCGITCASSIHFRNENDLLEQSPDTEKCYLEEILPRKMEHNLGYVGNITIRGDLKIMWATIMCVFR